MSHPLKYLVAYASSQSTRISLCMGALMYGSYALAHGAPLAWAVIGISAFVGIFMPLYAKLSNRAEEWANFKTACVTAGRLGRMAPQLIFNVAAFWILEATGSLVTGGLEAAGGLFVVALATTVASQGAQYVGIFLFNRGIGDPVLNTVWGLSANIIVTAIATTGLPIVREAFLVASAMLGLLVFGVGLLSDLRGVFYPRRGVGVFFGTFNPFHKTHLELVERAVGERGLSKLYVHPTLIPKFHRRALERGEIHIASEDGGLMVFETTGTADANVDYFPTGNRFYRPEIRRRLIEVAVKETNLSERIEVAFWPEIYDTDGFHGVLAEVRRRHPGEPIHAIHGSDFGGMTVRSIVDECGWTYPLAVRRVDGVSATAIRNGAIGMTSEAVSSELDRLAAEGNLDDSNKGEAA